MKTYLAGLCLATGLAAAALLLAAIVFVRRDAVPPPAAAPAPTLTTCERLTEQLAAAQTIPAAIEIRYLGLKNGCWSRYGN